MRAPGRAALVGVVAGLAVAIAPVPASADVVLAAGDLAPGSPAAVTVRVVNTRPATDLTAVLVEVPADVGPVTTAERPGWTLDAVTVVAGRPTVLRWTATTAPLAPGRHVDFTVLLAAVPAQAVLAFPATETYRDGDRAYWGTPAPGPAAARTAPSLPVDVQPDAAADRAGTDSLARLLAIAALLVALVGCATVAQGVRGRPAAGPVTILGLPARLFPAGRPADRDQSRDSPS